MSSHSSTSSESSAMSKTINTINRIKEDKVTLKEAEVKLTQAIGANHPVTHGMRSVRMDTEAAEKKYEKKFDDLVDNI